MTARELNWIKQKQREYKQLFGKKLEIDFEEMNGYDRWNSENEEKKFIEEAFNECIALHGADEKIIRDKNIRLNKWQYWNERAALQDFTNILFKKKLNKMYAAKMINRDRTNFYHVYSNIKRGRKNVNSG